MKYDIVNYKKYNISAVAVASDADWLLFAEQDAVLAPDAITQLKKAIAADEAAVAFELRQVPVDSGHHTDPVSLEIPFLATAAFMVKRSAFEQVGGFDSNFSVLALIDLSWRLRAAGGVLKACPQAVVNAEKPVDEKYEYIHGAYEKLLLGIKWGRAADAKSEFEHTLKNPRHFPGVRKELAKLYAQHFLHISAMKKIAKSNLYKPEVADFASGFGPQRGTESFVEITDQPLVSVVIRTHKRKEVLRHTLKCLRNQIYKNFEVVIVEDGENTAEEMVKTDFADLNINYYATGTNVGRGRAGNIGIERAKGEYVSFLDDDDYYYPDYISGHVAKFVDNPRADIVISGTMAVKSTTLSTDPYIFEYYDIFSVLFDHITLMDMCVRCRIPISGAMFRRTLYDMYGGMREDIGGDEDWAMWMKYITYGNRINPYTADINRGMCLCQYPADDAAAKQREENYRVYDKIMLYDENLVFSVHGSEIRKWEEYVQNDINHLRNIGRLDSFMANLKPLGVEKLEYNPREINHISARQINNYYYWLVNHYAAQ